MKRISGLIFIALVAVSLLLLVLRPDLLEKVWLWIVGLAGPIVGLIQKSFSSIQSKFSLTKETEEQKTIGEKSSDAELSEVDFQEKELEYRKEIVALKKRIEFLESHLAAIQKENIDNFSGTTVTVLRYYDDGETSLGILFIDDQFFCYTLEDTFRENKVFEHTRIPAAVYELGFRKEATPLTLRYRATRPWFDYHIEILHVSNFTGVYIHNGSTHEHTAGCLLVASGIYATDEKKLLQNSRQTFEQFYKLIGNKLRNGEKVRLKIFDETWFEQLKIKNKWRQS